ncbi:MAG: hypothetical protein ABMA64_17850 [Myxococcota bacterium]
MSQSHRLLSAEPTVGVAPETAPDTSLAAVSTESPAVDGGGGPGDKTGKVAYEDLLGTYLGGELYKALSGVLTQEKLNGVAKSALDAAFEWLAKQPADKRVDPDVVPAMLEVLRAEVDKKVGGYLESDGPAVVGALKGWTDAHPGTVVSVALLAAIAAIVADVDLPELKQKFGLGKDGSLGIEAKLGSIRHITLQQLKATLEYKSGTLIVAHQDGKTSVEGKVGDDKRNLQAKGKIEGKSLRIENVSGLYTSDSGDTKVEGSATRGENDKWSGDVKVTDTGGDWQTVDTARYDASDGSLTLGHIFESSDKKVDGSIGASTGPNGTTFDASATKRNDDLSEVTGSVSSGGGGLKLKGGYSDQTRTVGASIDDTEAGTTAGLTGSWKGENSTLNGSLSNGPAGTSALVGGTWSKDRTSLEGSLGRDPTGTTAKLGGKWSNETTSLAGSLTRAPTGTSGSLDAEWKKGNTALNGGFATGPTGTTTKLGGSWKDENTSVNGALQHGPTGTSASLGLRYQKADLLAEFNAALQSEGTSTLSGKVKSGKHTVEADAKFGLSDRVLQEVGFKYGFEDPESFRKYLLEVRKKLDVDQTTFSLLAQEKISDIYVRLNATATKTQDRFGYDATLQAARYLNPKTALIGGVRAHRDDVTGKSKINPQLGIQYAGVPVLVEYDTEKKRTSVSLGFKF